MRGLHLPGVVSLLDDGPEGDYHVVVMPWIEGEPFLGPERRAWEDIAPTVGRLLENLARVHVLGVLHRDLKPENILVVADGSPMMVDFGLAGGRSLVRERGKAGGTCRYVSPEQWAGKPCGPTTDLYSLGVMLFESLSGGHLPQSTRPANRYLHERLNHDPNPLRLVAPDVSPELAEVVDALVARHPEDRPRSAMDVLRRLGLSTASPDHPLKARLDALPNQASPTHLRALFWGPDLLHHLAEDAARVLWRRTGGLRETVEDELRLWVAAGLCHRDGDRIRIRRAAIQELDDSHSFALQNALPTGLSALACDTLDWLQRAWPSGSVDLAARASGAPANDVERAVEALAAHNLAWHTESGQLCVRPHQVPPDLSRSRRLLALLPVDSVRSLRLRAQLSEPLPSSSILSTLQQSITDGHFDAAWRTIELGLHAARQAEDLDFERAMSHQLVAVSCCHQRVETTEAALFELGRGLLPEPDLMPLTDLLRAFRATLRGELERARSLLAGLPPFDDEELELWRVTTEVAATMSETLGTRHRHLQNLHDWAQRSHRRQARWYGWMGQLRAQQDGLAEAAELHTKAAAMRTLGDGKLSSLVNAAIARLELGELEQALEMGSRCVALSREVQMPTLEALGWWTVRAARYRQGRTVVDEPELQAVLHTIPARTMGLLLLGEATRFWRDQRSDAFADLWATIPKSVWESTSAPIRALLRSLGAYEGLDSWPDLDANALPPLIAAQAWALRAWSESDDRRETAAHRARRALSSAATVPPGGRLEVLSPQECDVPMSAPRHPAG